VAMYGIYRMLRCLHSVGTLKKIATMDKNNEVWGQSKGRFVDLI